MLPEQTGALLPAVGAAGFVFTVSTAFVEVTDVLQAVTTQSKAAPESPLTTPVRVRFTVVAPLMVPPLLMVEPFFRH